MFSEASKKLNIDQVCPPAHEVIVKNVDTCKDYLNCHSGTPGLFSGCIKLFRNAAVIAVAAAALIHGYALAQTAGTYQVTNILSDGYVPALATDPKFIDPWGVSIGQAFWINTNVTGLNFVSKTDGSTVFKVTVPPSGAGAGTGSPTGTVFNSTPGFALSNGSPAVFLFSSLDGTISGWNGALFATGNHALIAIDNGAQNAVYTDMAFVTNANGTYILAANFGQGADVEVYDSSFKSAKLAGSFTDPNVPTGYAPYSVHSIGSRVFVTYMLRSTPPFAPGAGSYQETIGTNTGFIDMFDNIGNFVSRAVTGGNLNAPWGVAIAPTSFGVYGGDLLVGNFGDGLIDVYDPNTFAYLGQLADGTGKAFAYPGLWELVFGTAVGKSGYGNPNTLYFSAGLAQETHGLFGAIDNLGTSAAAANFNLSTSTQMASTTVGGTAVMTVSVAPANSFAGSVNLSCSGLPTGATCNFSTSALSVLPNAPATSTLTIQTFAGTPGGTGYGANKGESGRTSTLVAFALTLPFGSLLVFARRKRFPGIHTAGVLAVLLASAGLMVGCSYTPKMSTPAVPPTPSGSSHFTIMAVSGTVSQSTMVNLTIH